MPAPLPPPGRFPAASSPPDKSHPRARNPTASSLPGRTALAGPLPDRKHPASQKPPPAPAPPPRQRAAKRPASEKAKTPFGRYRGKCALSALVVCGKCGALYRRVTWYRKGEKKIMWRCGARLDNKQNCTESPTLEEADLQAAVMEAISRQYLHKDADMETTLQSIRSVLTPETADSEYAIRTKINELQKERKDLIAKALEENDDGKYDFQFARIKQELEKLQAQLEGVQAVQKSTAADSARMEELAALLEKFKESGLQFDDLLVRKVVETVRVESAEKLEVVFKDGNRVAVPLGVWPWGKNTNA